MKKGLMTFLIVGIISFIMADMQYDAYINGGKIDFKDGRYERAYEQFSKAVERKPDQAEARYYLGLSAAKLNKYNEAIDNFEKAFEMDSKYIEKTRQKPQYKSIVVSTYIKIGEDMLTQNKFKEAIKYTERAYEIDEENTALLSRLSNLYFNTGDTLKLKNIGKKLIEEDENNPEGYFILGKYYISVQNLDEADNNISKAVELYEKELDKVIDKLKEIDITIEKDTFIDFIVKINNARISGKSMEDIRNLIKDELAISENKANYIINTIGYASTVSFKIKEAYVWLSKIKLNKAKYDEAIEVSQKALALDPEDPEVKYSLGEAYFFIAENLKFKLDSLKITKEEKEKKKEEIKQYYTKSAEILSSIKDKYPDDSHIRVLIGASLIENDKIDDAIAILEEGKQIDPANVFIYNNLAVCYQKKGDNKKLNEVLKKMKELEKK